MRKAVTKSEFNESSDTDEFYPHKMRGRGRARFIREFFHHTMMNRHGSRVHSRISDNKLVVQLILPGVEKSSIKIRAKRNKVEINAERKKDVFLFQYKEAHKILELEHDVLPDNANALYSDGILTIKFSLAETMSASVEEINGE